MKGEETDSTKSVSRIWMYARAPVFIGEITRNKVKA